MKFRGYLNENERVNQETISLESPLIRIIYTKGV